MFNGLIKKKLIIGILIAGLITVLWSTRVIPSGLCILISKNYLDNNYPNRNFEYESVEYWSVIDEYLVYVVDNNGYGMTLTVSPIGGIIYDPLNPPG